MNEKEFSTTVGNGFYHNYYENGKLCYSCYYSDGKRNGMYEEYFSNETNRVKLSGYYRNGKKNGIFSEYYDIEQQNLEYNIAKSTVRFVNDKKEGYEHKYDENGLLLKQTIYRGGKKNGPSITYVSKLVEIPEDYGDKNISTYEEMSTVFLIKNYFNDKLEGQKIFFYINNGNSVRSIDYHDGEVMDGLSINNINKNGVLINFNSNNNKNGIEIQVVDREIKFIKHYNDGHEMYSDTYVNPLTNGKFMRALKILFG